MRVTVEFRRPASRTLTVLLGLVLLAVPSGALAAHLFPDVGNDNPFHDEIGAIAEAGITGGFGDGGYHPTDAVTRQAMAAFMHRGFGRIGHGVNAVLNTDIIVDAGVNASSDVTAMELTVDVPGAANAFSPKQIVYVHARIELVGRFSTSVIGCPCTFVAVIDDVTGVTLSSSSIATFESSSHSIRSHQFVADAAFVVPPGERLFRLRVSLGGRETPTNEAQFTISGDSTMTAMTFPFGPDGTNEINP